MVIGYNKTIDLLSWEVLRLELSSYRPNRAIITHVWQVPACFSVFGDRYFESNATTAPPPSRTEELCAV